MKKIKEIYENRISAWAKYSGYRIIKRHGQDYIAPDENAVLVWYDPVEKEETLIADVLNMGKSIADAKNGEEMTAAALDFVSKYGLLGWSCCWGLRLIFWMVKETSIWTRII